MISANQLTMHYGSTVALDDVSFSVDSGEVVGLLGPNGAGKTTLMRILTTFIYPTRGTASVAGVNVTENPIEARRQLGYLPETPPLYADMRVDDFLRFVGRARGLSGRRLADRMEWAAESCGVRPVWKHLAQELSLGFRQRVGLAQALLHDPKVVILDEPTSGLDPIQIIGIRALIRDLAKTKTILFSTHILQEAVAVSSRLLVINRGKLVAQGSPSELQAHAPGKKEDLLRLVVEAPRAEAEAALAGLVSVKRVVPAGISNGSPCFELASGAYGEAVKALNELTRQKGWTIKELSPLLPPLEETLVNLFRGKKQKSEDAS